MIIPTPLEYRGEHLVPALPAFSIVQMGLGTLDDIAAPWAGEHFRQTFADWHEDATDALLVREHLICLETHDFPTKKTRGALEELGGSERAPIQLGQFWYLLTHLEPRWSSAYVRKGDAVFTVAAAWIFKGRQTKVRSIYIESSEINKPHSRGAGCSVLSR